MNKRGLSPLIATVLIIAFTVVLASLLIVWVRGINNEFMGGSLCEYGANVKCTNINFKIVRVESFDNNITVTLFSNSNADFTTIVLQAFSQGVVVSSTSFEGTVQEPVIRGFENAFLTFNVPNLNEVDEIRVIPGLTFKRENEICELFCERVVKEVDF
ncbi:MAG: hypothetical protein KKH88_02745 [Nanoarchaeota archaeon]|nr:hypothetical protein [Nanoarchaeota archaeon]